MRKTSILAQIPIFTKHIIFDVMIICIGLFISSLGTALFYQAGMGSGAMATFVEGLHIHMNISYGTAFTATNIFFLILLSFCDKNMINIGTVLCVCLIGVFVDMGNTVFVKLPISTAPEMIRLICIFAGCGMMGIGLSLYVAVNRGLGALEGLVKHVSIKTRLNFGMIKIAEDIILTFLGIALNAKWGIGTLISAFTIGPIMKIFISLFERILKKTKD